MFLSVRAQGIHTFNEPDKREHAAGGLCLQLDTSIHNEKNKFSTLVYINIAQSIELQLESGVEQAVHSPSRGNNERKPAQE